MKIAKSNRGKILFCTMQYGAGYAQGTEKYLKNLTSELTKMGYECIIAAGNPKNRSTSIKHNKDSEIPHIELPTYGWTTLLGGNISSYEQLLKEVAPDFVHMANPAHIGINVLEAARKLKIPYFITATDFWWMCPKHTLTLPTLSFCNGFRDSESCRNCIVQTHPNKAVKKMFSARPTRAISTIGLRLVNHLRGYAPSHWENRNRILYSVLSSAKCVICLSRTGQKKLTDFFNLKNTIYLPAGLSSDWFQEKDTKERRSKHVLGYLGAIAPHKGLHTLTAAIRSLPKEVELVVAGPIADKEYFRDSIRGIDNLRYVGAINEKSAVKFMDSLDLLVLPSNSPENQPQVLLEAIARKIPVVSSSTPGCAEILNESSLFTTNDSSRLAERILKFLDHPEYFFHTSKVLSVEEMARETTELYLARHTAT
ncbi:glycosyltransferase [Microbulbifer sp. SA54]|uniref:glycosyltransferase n=1 Tax=Microbulbifer sp. SA54 TaxID=3401577 RepID=UPI003AADCF99